MERETMAEKLIDLDSIELAVAVFGMYGVAFDSGQFLYFQF